MTQGDRLLVLEIAHLLGVLAVLAAAVGCRHRRLVDLRVEAERLGRLGLVVAGKHALALVAVGIQLGEPGAAALAGHVGGAVEDRRDLGLETDRREQPRVAAHLVDPDRGDHLLDPLAQRRSEVGHIGAVVVDQRHLHHRVGADGVGTQAERHHHVVHVPDRCGAQHHAAAPAQVGLAVLDQVLAQRKVHRGQRQMRVQEAAVALVGGAVGEHHQLRSVAHGGRGLLLEALDRALGVLGLQAGDVEHGVAPAEGLPEVLEHVGLVLVRDRPVGLVGERRQAVVAAEQDRERHLDRVRLRRDVVQRRAARRSPRGRRSARPRARGRSPGWSPPPPTP